MRTAIVSDLHLGTTSGTDVALRPEVRERLLSALAEADRVVVLGDLLELRERPAHQVLDIAGPFLAELGAVTAGKQVTIVPGNHDHELVSPALDAARLAGPGRLPLAVSFSPGEDGLARRVASAMPDTDVELAYPGVYLRDDVYATHGHYLDMHMTVPRMECVVASAIARFAVGRERGGGRLTPDSYEASLAPIYALAYSIVQGAEARPAPKGGGVSRTVWSRSNPADRRGDLVGIALGRIAIPAGVALLNGLGLGPFRADISAAELRRAGLRAMAEVIRSLGIEAEHVIFGHTHRAGPIEGEDEGWSLPEGTRLTNTGSWLYERVFVGSERTAEGRRNPYWPGCIAWLDDEGPPRLVNVLGDLDLSAPDRASGARALTAPTPRRP